MEQTKTFERTWRNKWITNDATSPDEMIAAYRNAIEEIEALKAAGVEFDFDNAHDDYIELYTDDPKVADEFGFNDFDEDDI
jgi:hypothetical protein